MPKIIPKFGESEFIQFVGLNELSAEEQQIVKDITTPAFEKIQRDLKTLAKMVVHIKTYEHEGSRKKYSLHVRLNAHTRVFESCKSHDWDLSRALHKAMDDLKHQVIHAFHTDTTRK
ncbi:MAG: hypothetical protein HY363_04630 [Candidatus Aenigmarchaeota archaeon]|nr:hypothetical protein [Candidatus Aenigmarchaeota archaeon]